MQTEQVQRHKDFPAVEAEGEIDFVEVMSHDVRSIEIFFVVLYSCPSLRSYLSLTCAGPSFQCSSVLCCFVSASLDNLLKPINFFD